MTEEEKSQRARAIVARYADRMAADIPAAVRQQIGSGRSKGKLTRKFRWRIVEEFGDPAKVIFRMPSHGYILHHGVEAKTVSDPSRNRIYNTRGIQPFDHVNKGIVPKLEGLATELAEVYGDFVSAQFRF